ncbi:MAG: glycine--tRNA ligase [Candidatus Sungiibacteriota bacterium]
MASEQTMMEKITALCKRRGFIFPGSEIYGGLAGTWDYGPLGVELKNNIKREFWHAMVYGRDDVVGLDAAIMMHPKVWEASGHTDAFTDPLVECKTCHARFRADHPEEIEEHTENHNKRKEPVSWTEPRQFNLLVEAKLGAVEGEKTTVYLRGEITQGVHVNFKNVVDSSRVKIPFGIAQIGKAFRNEITPGNFIFRSREFEQIELQYYVRPDEKEAMRWFEYWKEERMQWHIALGMKKEHLRFCEHAPDERAHYARAAWDIEYDSPFGGWKEMMGVHHRGDWDLSRHAKFSGADMTYYDEEKKERYTPWVIETSGGVDRAMLFFLIDAYHEDGERKILKLHPRLAPYKAAVFPLLANKPQLVEKARAVYKSLQPTTYNLQPIAWDERGNIGKRYYAQDEIGTPWCITIDFQTLEDDTVTIRDRDTAKQERIAVSDLPRYFEEKLRG